MKINRILFSIGLAISLFYGCKNKHIEDYQSLSRIDSLFTAAVVNNEIPGAVALISYQNQIIYHKAFGYNTIHDKEIQRVDDIFRLASMTKALTAVAILQLQEQNKLQVDDYLYQYLPEFKNPQLLLEVLPDSNFTAQPAQSEITIHQLLTHTSGIGYGFQDDKYNALILKNNVSEGFGFDSRTSRENIKKIAALPLLHEPGEAYTYGLSFDVLGVLIEEVSGLRYDEYITQHILKPCGMTNSYFIVPETHQHRLPTVYEPFNEDKLQVSSYADTTYPCVKERQFFSGGADLCATAKDYYLFLQMLANQGTINGNLVLQPTSVAAMLSKQSPLAEEDSYQGYAAWVTNTQGAQSSCTNKGAYGFGGFFDTYSWNDPEAELSAVLLLQMYPNNNHRIHEQFQQLTYNLLKQ